MKLFTIRIGDHTIKDLYFQDDEKAQAVVSYLRSARLLDASAWYTTKGSIKAGSVQVYLGSRQVAAMVQQ